ncbi:unnamed protein product [Amoebophrya sp. A25]|nr:unnamed protein product [Amoebophrya sp. A25]|eukprot:GSA25T00025051001.1
MTVAIDPSHSMEEDLPEWLLETQRGLGQALDKPRLTADRLIKPPFRFLFDIVAALFELYALDCFDELLPANYTPSTKQEKIEWLTQWASIVSSELGEGIEISALKVVCGHEPERTNFLLQKTWQLVLQRAEPKRQMNATSSLFGVTADGAGGVEMPHSTEPAPAGGVVKQLEPSADFKAALAAMTAYNRDWLESDEYKKVQKIEVPIALDEDSDEEIGACSPVGGRDGDGAAELDNDKLFGGNSEERDSNEDYDVLDDAQLTKREQAKIKAKEDLENDEKFSKMKNLMNDIDAALGEDDDSPSPARRGGERSKEMRYVGPPAGHMPSSWAMDARPSSRVAGDARGRQRAAQLQQYNQSEEGGSSSSSDEDDANNRHNRSRSPEAPPPGRSSIVSSEAHDGPQVMYFQHDTSSPGNRRGQSGRNRYGVGSGGISGEGAYGGSEFDPPEEQQKSKNKVYPKSRSAGGARMVAGGSSSSSATNINAPDHNDLGAVAPGGRTCSMLARGGGGHHYSSDEDEDGLLHDRAGGQPRGKPSASTGGQSFPQSRTRVRARMVAESFQPDEQGEDDEEEVVNEQHNNEQQLLAQEQENEVDPHIASGEDEHGQNEHQAVKNSDENEEPGAADKNALENSENSEVGQNQKSENTTNEEDIKMKQSSSTGEDTNVAEAGGGKADENGNHNDEQQAGEVDRTCSEDRSSPSDGESTDIAGGQAMLQDLRVGLENWVPYLANAPASALRARSGKKDHSSCKTSTQHQQDSNVAGRDVVSLFQIILCAVGADSEPVERFGEPGSIGSLAEDLSEKLPNDWAFHLMTEKPSQLLQRYDFDEVVESLQGILQLQPPSALYEIYPPLRPEEDEQDELYHEPLASEITQAGQFNYRGPREDTVGYSRFNSTAASILRG